MRDIATNMPDYESAIKNDRLEVPEFFNFGFDVVDNRFVIVSDDGLSCA